ncbi:hypothetical protein ABZ714_14235 [Streptomyces sp. NPDC006798]|uniref:hypothetical protein n=1 Tax=unclassified Streptomyces TaxID=2593676 RepID=UPI0033ED83B7
MMSREQLEVIEGELDVTIGYLLINRMMDADLVIVGLENVLTNLAEAVAATREE